MKKKGQCQARRVLDLKNEGLFLEIITPLRNNLSKYSMILVDCSKSHSHCMYCMCLTANPTNPITPFPRVVYGPAIVALLALSDARAGIAVMAMC